MSSRLAILRSQLSRLRRARAAARAASAWSLVGSSALLALLGCLALDYVFRLAVGERIVVTGLATGAVGWAFWRFAVPLLGPDESEIALAAIVEREHQIDSDLVAALQFESARSGNWGSPQLSGAVVDYVAAAAPSINVFKGFQSEAVMRRGVVFAGCLAIWLLMFVVAPHHVAVFANRILLGSKHYPTRTRIDRIIVGDQEVVSDGQMMSKDCQIAQGRPLRFVVECSGRLPEGGNVTLLAAGGSQARTQLELKPNSAINAGKRSFTAELPRLNDDVMFRVSLGDAWTEGATVHVIPLPVVDLKMAAKPPAYAAPRAKSVNVPGRQPPVLEGSSIDVALECMNRKPLNSAWLLLQTQDGARRYDLVAVDEDKLLWRLPAASPLATVRGDVQYEAQVVDTDGLSLESPIRGRIRVRPDELPTVTAETVHRVVLPTAQPVVRYRATDDYGISHVSIVVQVQRAGTKAANDTPTDARWRGAESHRFEILPARQITDDRLPAEGNYVLPLSQLALGKGDSVQLTLEATDYRGTTTTGAAAGRVARSNPILLEVSDESGVMAAISQPDQRSEQQLTDIIKRQLGIGDER